MKSFINIPRYALVTIAVLATNLVLALPTSETGSSQSPDLPDGYTLDQLHITGEVNGVAVNYTGSVQEVFAQLDAEDNSFKLSDLAGIQRRTITDDLEQLDKRYPTDLHCLPVSGQNWHGADSRAISDGINFLREGWQTCNVGPRKCVRASCSWNAAIYVCNNQDKEIRPTCDLIAAFAQVMLDKCLIRRGIFQHNLVGGQYWDNENWNVNIYSDRC
ncbi:hypothetical protein ONS95_003828 [Cadophora gregata]|uniref:uncharacterized protein n=1 Tax=Cadophora gregata TaxID=51156 RepID=UPI0026DD9057|nr:uncharacterized protein ONS95_003828 [Cadophora gregata]KAK0107122.1 hypothetical protein ONS95_003828 [Cadophora gregata]